VWTPTRPQPPKVTAYSVVDTTVDRNSEGPTVYSVKLDLTYDNGTHASYTLPMQKQDGAFRACPHSPL
jgi:hypothetical protein